MSHYSGSVPDTYVHRGEWMQHGACKADPDAMHPDTNQAGIAYAKRICAACCVALECLADALRTGDNQWGIRGGLSPEQRRAVDNRLTSEQYNDLDAVAAAVHAVLQPATPQRTLRDVWEERTYNLPDGHLGWRGRAETAISFQGRAYTPRQISFALHRGRKPVGMVRRTCGVDGCVHPLCLTDKQERREQRENAARESDGAAV